MGITSMIPNILTGTNLAVGMFSMVYAIQGSFIFGAILILIAALLDRLDGKLARKIGASSEFGKELDSLADLVSFGVAPAIIIHQLKLHEFGMLGTLIVVLYVLCGALRLARFNIINVQDYFVGMPITVAGSLVALMVLLAGQISIVLIAVLLVVLSGMMVSTFKIPKI